MMETWSGSIWSHWYRTIPGCRSFFKCCRGGGTVKASEKRATAGAGETDIPHGGQRADRVHSVHSAGHADMLSPSINVMW